MMHRILNIPAKEEEAMRNNLGRAIQEKMEISNMVTSKRAKGAGSGLGSDAGRKSGGNSSRFTTSAIEFPPNMSESDKLIYRPSAFTGN